MESKGFGILGAAGEEGQLTGITAEDAAPLLGTESKETARQWMREAGVQRHRRGLWDYNGVLSLRARRIQGGLQSDRPVRIVTATDVASPPESEAA